jgi:CubicO group peptidase (beta-lactamase class C family)
LPFFTTDTDKAGLFLRQANASRIVLSIEEVVGNSTAQTATIREAFACRKNNPALSVSVVKNGKIVFANGYGVQSLEDKKPVTNTTLFGIASLTKGFTSALFFWLMSRQYLCNSKTTLIPDAILMLKVYMFY